MSNAINFGVVNNVSSSTGQSILWNLKNSLFEGECFQFYNNVRYNISLNELLDYFPKLGEKIHFIQTYTGEYIFWDKDWICQLNTGLFSNSFDDEKEEVNVTVCFHTKTRPTSMKMVKAFVDNFASNVVSESTTTNWCVLNPDDTLGYTTMVLKKNKKLVPEFYPFIRDCDVDGFIDDFKNSNSNVLILTGNPGLGKSSFINYLLNRTNWNSVVAYDERVMIKDDFYVNFLAGHRDVMIIEDADILLQSREGSGNHTMAKILNVSDGIIDTGKKFIFTANLKDIDDIDSALIRPGRCFDIIQFRELDHEEALKAAAAIGRDLPEKNGSNSQYSMAEIYNSRVNRDNVIPIRRIGFTG